MTRPIDQTLWIDVQFRMISIKHPLKNRRNDYSQRQKRNVCLSGRDSQASPFFDSRNE